MWTMWIGAFATGLVGGIHCIGMCGGFAACAASQRGGTGLWWYHLGRLMTYATLGGVAGLAGALLLSLRQVGLVLAALLLVVFVARMWGVKLGSGIRFPHVERWAARAMGERGVLGPVALGASTALLPCGLVYTALALPVVAGGPLVRAGAMVLFGLGTMPLLSMAGLGAGHAARLGPRWRRGIAVLVAVAGVATLVERWPSPAQSGQDAALPACCQTAVPPPQ